MHLHPVRRLVMGVVVVALFVSAAPALAAPKGAERPPSTRYIVTVAAGTSAKQVAAGHATAAGLRVARVFSAPLRSFVVDATATGAQRLRTDRRVVRFEADGIVSATAVQTAPTWGLDRSDQRSLPLDGAYLHHGDGQGVTVYVVDSGVRPHDQFGTRLRPGFTAIHDGVGHDDCNGHGTHVAGTAAGAVHGMAKGAAVVPVRVLGCDGTGTTSGVIAGIDWILTHRSGPAVVNLSLSGSASAALDDAVRRAVVSGLTVVAAAGNNGTDACTRSPGRVTEVLTVAATNRYDSRPSWSNHGPCVDLFAPGASITSTGISSPTATATYSGTSMAAPHVAGAAAIAHGVRAGATPADVSSLLLTTATTGRVQSPGTDTPNRLLFTSELAFTAPVTDDPVNLAPIATATATCSGTTCTFDARASTDPDGIVMRHTWSFSDGRTAATPTVTFKYSKAGTVTGSVSIIDDRGATSRATTAITCSKTGNGRKKTLSCNAGEQTVTGRSGRPPKRR